MGVPAQQNTEIIEPSNNPLKLDAINEKNGHGCLVFPDVVQENVLNVLRFFRSHGSSPTPFLEPSQPVQAEALGRDGRVAAIQMGARRSRAPVLLLTTPRKIPSANSPRSNSPRPGSGLNRSRCIVRKASR